MRSVEDQVAQQISFYELRRKKEHESGRPGRGTIGKLHYGPYVLISRDEGSGGGTLARAMGQRLGWQVFGPEIVDQIAEHAQVRRGLIESLDERERNFIEEILTPGLRPGEMGHLGYLLHLKQVVLALGQQGEVIIVGRGARYILPPEFGLRVRLVAPFETRVQRVAREHSISQHEARVQVNRRDHDRASFIRHSFRMAIDDPFSNDVLINTEHLTPEQVLEMALHALHAKLGVPLG